MKKTPTDLPDDIETLKKMLLERDKRIAKLERVNQQLEDKLQRLLEQFNLELHITMHGDHSITSKPITQ